MILVCMLVCTGSLSASSGSFTMTRSAGSFSSPVGASGLSFTANSMSKSFVGACRVADAGLVGADQGGMGWKQCCPQAKRGALLEAHGQIRGVHGCGCARAFT